MNHYRHHLGDYAKDTAHLSMLEDGAYSRLMRRYYSSEAPLPVDMAELYRIASARTNAEKEAVRNVVKDFFIQAEDGYHQKRIDKEIAEYQTKAARNREVGRTGGRPKENPDITQMVSEKEPKRLSGGNPNETLASSQKPVAREKRFPEVPDGGGSQRLAALAAICLQNRVNTDGAKSLLHLRHFAEEGVTEQQLADAILIARDRKPDPEVIPLAYLVPIVVDLRAGRVRARPPSPAEVIANTIAAVNAKESNAAH